MPRLPNLNRLRAFEAAARLMSFTRAAQELHVTQTAVSHQVRRLEQDLGVRLFERAPRRLRLTPEGAELLAPLTEAFTTLQRAAERLVARGAQGPLTVSTLASFAIKWLVPHLAKFQAAHPDIEVRLTTSTALVNFHADDVDVAIRYGTGDWPGLHAERLMTEDILPVCSPALLQGEKPLHRPADLAGHTLLHVSAYPDDWRVWLTAAGVDGVDPGRGPVFDMALNATQAAIEGMGVALGRSILVEDDLAAGRLVAPFPGRQRSDAAYYFVTLPERLRQPRVQRFRAWLHAEVAGTRPPVDAAD